jgi:sulfate transport system permease protein
MTALFRRRPASLQGFSLTFGITLAGLGVAVLLPLAAIVLAATAWPAGFFWSTVTAPRVLAACRLSLLTALVAAAIASLLGLLVSWVLVRYRFPFRRLFDALVDLPFALPTAVAGITLTTLWAPHGWLGRPLQSLGISAAFTPLGIVVALVFLGLPFSVRTLQPVLEGLDPEMEDAATSLGARSAAVFGRVLLPELVPAWLTGFTLAFARGLGEYGSVVFISGNMPMKTEVAPLLIMTKLEQYDVAGATAIAVALLGLSFLLLLLLNRLQTWSAEAAA